MNTEKDNLIKNLSETDKKIIDDLFNKQTIELDKTLKNNPYKEDK